MNTIECTYTNLAGIISIKNVCACTHAISCLCVEWKSKRKTEEGGATGGRIDVRQRERGWERGKRERDSTD